MSIEQEWQDLWVEFYEQRRVLDEINKRLVRCKNDLKRQGMAYARPRERDLLPPVEA